MSQQHQQQMPHDQTLPTVSSLATLPAPGGRARTAVLFGGLQAMRPPASMSWEANTSVAALQDLANQHSLHSTARHSGQEAVLPTMAPTAGVLC
jgi:hypothetical protein